jgi:predicted permease
VTLAREDARGVWIWPWLESVWQDMAYALRDLRRHPAFACVALLTLGSAIGINVSAFAAFNAVLLKPWPVRHASDLLELQAPGHESWELRRFTLDEYRQLAATTRTLSGLVAMGCGPDGGACEARIEEQDAHFQSVSANSFSALGVTLERGRAFRDDEDDPLAPAAVAVLSHRAWRNRFGSDPGILGRTLRINEAPFTVIGVASGEFRGTGALATDVWIPFSSLRLTHPGRNRIFRLRIVGRLAPGVPLEEARAELSVLVRRLSGDASAAGPAVVLAPPSLLPGNPRNAYPPFALLFAGALLVLAIACVNVGNLLLARASARGREIATRVSLGAGAPRLLRQLLTESLVLGAAASVVGAALAAILPGLILDRLLLSAGQPGTFVFDLDLNLRVVGCTIVVAVISTAAFGLAPALHATRAAAAAGLKGHETIPGTRLRAKSVLLAAQVCGSVVLLVATGLIVRTVEQARDLEFGFAVEDVSVVSFEQPAYYDRVRTGALSRALLEGAQALDGAERFAFATNTPFGVSSLSSFSLPGDDPAVRRSAEHVQVSPAYFEVLQIPLVAGRSLTAADAASAVLVNEAFARMCCEGTGAIGRTLIVRKQSRNVVGIVADADTGAVALSGFVRRGRAVRGSPRMYAHLRRETISYPVPILLHRADARAVEALTASARRVDPRVRVHVRTLAEVRDQLLAEPVMLARIAGILGALALAMASVGMFGVFAYAGQQRAREIGVRMALGARPAQVLRGVFGSTIRAMAAGSVAGVLLAAIAALLLRSQVPAVSPIDPMTYGRVGFVLFIAAVAATYVPVRRAIRVDPMVTLRCE